MKRQNMGKPLTKSKWQWLVRVCSLNQSEAKLNDSKQVLPMLLYSLQTQNSSKFPAELMKATYLYENFQSCWDWKFVTVSIIIPATRYNYYILCMYSIYTCYVYYILLTGKQTFEISSSCFRHSHVTMPSFFGINTSNQIWINK